MVYWSFPQDVLHISKEPAFVAQSDVRPTGDQEVTGSSPAGSATFFHEIFYTVIRSLPLLQKGSCQFMAKE